MTRPESRNPAGPGGASDGHQGAGDQNQCIALPIRPRLSDTGERLLAQRLPAPVARQVTTRLSPRIGDITVTGQLTMKLPRNAATWELRRSFSGLGHLPDGVTVVVKLRARQVVDLADALGGLDNLPQITLVITGPVHRFQAVADAVTALRASAGRRAAELRAVAS